MAFSNDAKTLLAIRVAKLDDRPLVGRDPPSRTRRLITRPGHADDGAELSVESNFLLYRTRFELQEDKWIGPGRTSCCREATTRS